MHSFAYLLGTQFLLASSKMELFRLFRPCLLPSDVGGKLFLHSMPGRREDWETFLAAGKAAEIGSIACLTSREEIIAKSPRYAEALQKDQVQWEVVEFPITDYGIPADTAAFTRFISTLSDQLRENHAADKGLLLHCAAGIGRTGSVAVCLLHHLGMDFEDATARVSAAGSGPETDEQRRFVQEFCRRSPAGD